MVYAATMSEYPLTSLVWLPEDAYAGRCSVAEVGHARPLQPLGAPQDVQAMARALAPHVLASLALLARSGGYGAVEAAKLVLTYAYGPPGVPRETPQSEAPAEAPPEGWRPAGGRLSYPRQ